MSILHITRALSSPLSNKLIFCLEDSFIVDKWPATVTMHHMMNTDGFTDVVWNLGWNKLPPDSFLSDLYSQVEYSTGEFKALQLIVFVVFGVVD